MPLFTSLAFDLTLTSVFLPLVSGGTLHTHAADDPLKTLQSIAQDDALHTIKLTPSHLSVLLELPTNLTGLRQLILGGEALSTALVEKVKERWGHQVKVMNEYGPTECTVGCMLYEYRGEHKDLAGVPIGHAMDQAILKIVDLQDNEVPRGVAGELHVSGECVTQGYLNRPLVTAQQFYTRADVNTYKTGDMVRRRNDGVIEYLGRKDRQVKYNGIRIELDEVGNVLAQSPEVTQAHVCVMQVRSRDVLIAYCVLASEEKSQDTASLRQTLRSHLEKVLPRTHVPSSFQFVKRLPLSLNGKIDERALPQPEHVSSDNVSEPVNEAQRCLLEAWCSVLGDGAISMDSNFFDHGGDSLNAVRIAAAVSEQGWQLDPNLLLEQASIRVAAEQMALVPLDTESEENNASGLTLSAADTSVIEGLFNKRESP